MTTDQRNALFRLHRRCVFMRSEAEAHLLKAAADSGDGEALKRAARVEEALRELESYAHERLYAGESEGEAGR